MMNFQMFSESMDMLDKYYLHLDRYLRGTRGWRIAPITDDVQHGVVSVGHYNIIDDTGRTLGRDTQIGKIQRVYDSVSDTLKLEHISAAFDASGRKRIKGLRIVDTVYPFDVKFVVDNHIKHVIVDAVNPVTERKFVEHFREAGFVVVKQGNKLIASN